MRTIIPSDDRADAVSFFVTMRGFEGWEIIANMIEHSDTLEQRQHVGFIPPAPTHCLIKVLQTFWPLYAELSPFKLSVHLDSIILNVLKSLRNERLIICPNHSAHDDPLVAFAISAQVRQEFYYLTAREIFMWHPSLRSLWLQHLGCYSVLRASPDVQAYKETCALLLDAPNKVVVFPEGEVTHQNRLVMPPESGAERMALATAQALSSAGNYEPVFLLPVGIAYRYPHDITSKLFEIIAKQERNLDLLPMNRHDVGKRIHRAFDKMLDVLEQNHCCSLPGQSLGERVSNFLDRIIRELAAACATDIPVGTQREQLHTLKKLFINRRYTTRRQVVSDYDRLLYKQLKRAINLIDINDESFNHVDSQEALAELVCILEYEVSGRVTLHPEKTAYVTSSAPINAQSYVKQYEQDRQQTVSLVEDALRKGINDALDRLQAAWPEHALLLLG